ncbi:uncharacterized protein ASPGLDRAFT_119238 [Aspergillus glaucus CBS 516.65]|uniref:Uncharacterized protein n=1 Tax=Aspergillus glaucus CBS 516.65 TaxID=1160497 RepID=A0A1L9VVW6_ASPGL|nr:hypothetical protein ASPGLDRAFT_119238 [Aspergillus glaucus CBS 516.65]OJJ88050.1 hypothetical protein ASPGLDRAFT_119238 [Aspergillus glaucus CBS 516.65]
MADPEGVEDDLFADLYEADEPTAQATSATEAPRPSISAASATAAQPIGHIAQSVETPQFEAEPPQNFYQAPQYQGYDASQAYGVGQLDGHGGINAPAPAAEPEPQGTGIKEDG